MRSLRKRWAVVAVASVAVAGGGFAYAAGQGSSDPRDAYLDNVAKRLNVSPAKLREAMAGARKELGRGPGPVLKPAVGMRHGFAFAGLRADIEAVAKYLGLSPAELRKQVIGGRSLADIAKQQNKDVTGLKKLVAERLAAHAGDIVEMSLPKLRGGPPLPAGPGFRGRGAGPRLHGGPPAFGFGLRAFGADIAAVADYLGLSRRELRARIADGTSLADIAKAQKKDVAGLKKLIGERARKRLDDAVKRGLLDKQQAERMAQKLDAHLDDVVEMSLPRAFRSRHP